MKKFKRIMALVIAMAMVLTMMSMAAFADDGLTTDATISITGLEQGDTVNLYQVLEWTDGVGWTLTKSPGFENLNTAGVNALIANTPNTQLSADDLAAIATYVGANSPTAVDPEKVVGADKTYTYTAGTQAKAGMYVALITAAKAGTVYNPIVISADFSSDNSTNTIPASSAINGTAVAKRKDITVEKTEPKITNDDGDTYDYTIETTIPVYSSAFTDQYFTLTDTLSDHLDLDAETIKINNMSLSDWVQSLDIDAPVGSFELTTEDHGFVLKLKHALVSKLAAATPITITYSAKLNVPVSELTNVKEEDNEVTVVFPNNPNDLSGKKVTALKDGTAEYTFSLDGSLFGNSSWDTAELVKVGVDKNGSPIEAVINVSNGSEHAALKDAKFGLFKTSEAAAAYTGNGSETPTSADGFYQNSVFNGIVTTDAMGLMEINGLDVGTYYLKELDAPSGYIKDTQVHTITIEADIDGDAQNETGEAVTEYYTVDGSGNVTWSKTQTTGSIPYTYYVPVLRSYKVTVDGNESTYTMTLDGPKVSSVTPAESSTDIANTKGVELPSTGGIGTTIFYIVGAILVLGAGVVLITRRRMDA